MEQGSRSPKIADLSKTTGLSTAAISIYLRNPETNRVSKTNKAVIDKAVKSLGYRPNVFARALSSNQSKSIAILIPYNGPLFRSDFINEIISGLQTSFFSQGYSILFPPAKGDRSPKVLRNQLQHSSGYDGYILFGTRYCSLDEIRENAAMLKETGVPFVVVNAPEIEPEVNQVIFAEGRKANPLQYLLSLGHKNILLMIGRENSPDSQEALMDYHRIFAENSVEPINNFLLYGDYEIDSARSVLKKRLEENSDFTALYCLSDPMALGAYEALNEKGLRVPHDVSVIGRNDFIFTRFMNPPLTTVHRAMYEAGEKAAQILLQSRETGRSGIKLHLESSLIVRESTKVLR